MQAPHALPVLFLLHPSSFILSSFDSNSLPQIARCSVSFDMISLAARSRSRSRPV